MFEIIQSIHQGIHLGIHLLFSPSNLKRISPDAIKKSLYKHLHVNTYLCIFSGLWQRLGWKRWFHGRSHNWSDWNESLKVRKYLIKSRFFKNRELFWSNLPQNSNLGLESFVQKSGVQIPVGEGQIFLSCFLFIFTFFIKNCILTHKILFFLSSFTN